MCIRQYNTNNVSLKWYFSFCFQEVIQIFMHVNDFFVQIEMCKLQDPCTFIPALQVYGLSQIETCNPMEWKIFFHSNILNAT